MLCFRRFASCDELFTELRLIFNKEADETAQLHVIRAVEAWISIHCFSLTFTEDAERLVEVFANFVPEHFHTFLLNAIAAARQRKVCLCETNIVRNANLEQIAIDRVYAFQGQAGAVPVSPAWSNDDVRRVARAFTAITWPLCHQFVFSGEIANNARAAALPVVERFNQVSKSCTRCTFANDQVSNWIKTRVVFMHGAANRIRLLASFIELMHELIELGNLQDAIAIIAGLNSASIFRLKVLNSSLKKKVQAKRQRGIDLFSADRGYHALREHLNAKSAPLIPYLGDELILARSLSALKVF
jgi:hypothetical protein